MELKAERYISTCFDYIDTFADGYFTSEYFLNIKLGTLDVLLRRHTLADYREVKLFKAVVKWVDHQCSLQNLEASYENRRKILGNVIYDIPFLLMTLDEFTTDVIGVDILNDQESIGIIKAIAGHHVQNLKWDLSKKKCEMSTYFERMLEGNEKKLFVALIILFITSYLTRNYLYTLLIIFCAMGILYFYPNIAYKLIPNFVVKWLYSIIVQRQRRFLTAYYCEE